MILLISEIKSKKICKSGEEDITFQLFHVIARGESNVKKRILCSKECLCLPV